MPRKVPRPARRRATACARARRARRRNVGPGGTNPIRLSGEAGSGRSKRVQEHHHRNALRLHGADQARRRWRAATARDRSARSRARRYRAPGPDGRHRARVLVGTRDARRRRNRTSVRAGGWPGRPHPCPARSRRSTRATSGSPQTPIGLSRKVIEIPTRRRRYRRINLARVAAKRGREHSATTCEPRRRVEKAKMAPAASTMQGPAGASAQ